MLLPTLTGISTCSAPRTTRTGTVVPGMNIYGVELDGVERNGPADLAGLKKGDIIVEFDGKPIRTAGDLRYRAGAATPLGVVQVVVFRDGQLQTIPVKLGRQR